MKELTKYQQYVCDNYCADIVNRESLEELASLLGTKINNDIDVTNYICVYVENKTLMIAKKLPISKKLLSIKEFMISVKDNSEKEIELIAEFAAKYNIKYFTLSDGEIIPVTGLQ